MIDLHNHLLAGFDDGSRQWAETLAMCRIAVQDGIRIIVATPHSFNEDFTADPEQVVTAVRILNGDLETRRLPLTVLPGMEVRVVPELVELAQAGRILPLGNGRHILVELHAAHIPAGFVNLVEQARQAGYGIILCHPEKNLGIQQDDRFVQELVRRFTDWEFLIQISADSLTGEAGPVCAKSARSLLKNGLVHIIASDAHSSEYRTPRLTPAVEIASHLIGKENARRMVWDIPRAVLSGLGFPRCSTPLRQKRWWHALWPFGKSAP